MEKIISHLQYFFVSFFLMIRRPPRSTLSSSSAASDVYKRQVFNQTKKGEKAVNVSLFTVRHVFVEFVEGMESGTVSYTHLTLPTKRIV